MSNDPSQSEPVRAAAKWLSSKENSAEAYKLMVNEKKDIGNNGTIGNVHFDMTKMQGAITATDPVGADPTSEKQAADILRNCKTLFNYNGERNMAQLGFVADGTWPATAAEKAAAAWIMKQTGFLATVTNHHGNLDYKELYFQAKGDYP